MNFRREIGKKMPGKNKNVTTFLNEASLLLRFFSFKRLEFPLLLPEYSRRCFLNAGRKSDSSFYFHLYETLLPYRRNICQHHVRFVSFLPSVRRIRISRKPAYFPYVRNKRFSCNGFVKMTKRYFYSIQ